MTSHTKQSPLPGTELGTEREWIVTFEDCGLEDMVLVEAMTRREARETFNEEFELFDIGVHIDPDAFGVDDDDDDWTWENIYARSRSDAKEIALQRDRKYQSVYEVSDLGNTATVTSVDRFEDVDGWKPSRAKREAEVVA
jgi:hypothetical protein